ncbi:DoxX family protein [Rhodopirellula sp. MGV]|uniref:DoxX family protein n=1 Tax=Rhodopirellula sp. MGV TaxID=2023130 RepID=UPI000B975511|nr:DoxX family protein [Rhodopirellula sp. MGV]OYP36555.1 DoxX family protein [Rhodopirellula sp. MGV]PNY34531.1 DoxX family protein [Rhodopirellula baltica]
MENTETSLIPAALLATRVALAASFLSAVADRFGLWGEVGTGSVAWGNFENFLAYTGLLLWFLPASLVAIAGWVATVLEVVIAIGLLVGFRLTTVACCSGALLLSFAISMTLATGFEAALSYSVWTAASASFLLAAVSANHAPSASTQAPIDHPAS